MSRDWEREKGQSNRGCHNIEIIKGKWGGEEREEQGRMSFSLFMCIPFFFFFFFSPFGIMPGDFCF